MRLPRLVLLAVLLSAGAAEAQDGHGPDASIARTSPDLQRARVVFERGRWADAAVLLDGVTRDPAANDARSREIARFYLGIALHRLELHVAGLRVFAEVAASPTHFGFQEARRWLVALDLALPEPSGVAAHVRHYGPRPIALGGHADRELDGRMNYLIGKLAFDERRYEDAAKAFDEVDPSSSRYIAAQFIGGMSFVAHRKAVPAVKRFARIVAAIGEDAKVSGEKKRLRDLAWISMARTYYSAGARIGPFEPAMDTVKLSSSVKFWNKIDIDSPLWPDAQLESTWGYFLAGNLPRMIGNLHDLESGYVEATLYPEADIVRGIVAYTLCRYDDVVTVVARTRKRYEPIRRELRALLDRLAKEPDEGVLAFHEDVHARRATVPRVIRPIVDTILTDRPLRRDFDHLRHLEDEEARFWRLPASFRVSALGRDVAAGLARARRARLGEAALRVREVYQRRLDALDAHLLDASKLLIDAQRGTEMEELRRRTERKPSAEPLEYGMPPPDVEHANIPFDGEFWKDELGSYRALLTSRCPR